MSDPEYPFEFWTIDGLYLGTRLRVYPRIDSTNNVVAQLAAAGESEGIAVLADEQTGGRGQYGRTWIAPPRSGVLLSVLLRPPELVARAPMLTACAAVSVCRLVRHETGRSARIKWPNDVYVDDRKICGILVEGVRDGFVVGIGLNVTLRPEEFDALGLPTATSLRAFTEKPLDTRLVAQNLLWFLGEEYGGLQGGNRLRRRDHSITKLENTWREHIGLLGQRVRVTTFDGELTGILETLALSEVAVRGGADLWTLQPERVRQIERM
jgi:BirA family transcriptional regulator, biotin operon repressor / biotin---[acetyl-CoA-carboxylase] ligase